MNARSTHSGDGIRKAAILVASLDQAAADALLDQMGESRAAQVRQAVVGLGEIDAVERQRVIEEFFRIGPLIPKKQTPGIELDGRLARKLGLAPGVLGSAPTAAAPADGPPFQFLQETAADKLARALAGERAQTIALVLAHLPPEQAGGVLVRLPPAQQVEVVRRLVDLEETDADILREVERGLHARLSQQVRMQRRRVAGLSAVHGILEASDGQVAVQILDNLAAHDQSLAERLGPPPLAFDDLVYLDDASLAAVFRVAEGPVTLLALVGAPPELIDRFVAPLSPVEAEAVRRKLDHPGPIRLSDVEGARQQVADLARRLALAGRIRLPEAAGSKQ
jgi:flagellar motor switch protein FliG